MVRLRTLVFLPLLVACSSSSGGGTEQPGPSNPKPKKPDPTPLPALSDAPTTATRTLTLKTARQSYKDGPNPALPDALADYLKRGFGDTTPADGQAPVVRTIDNSTPPAAGPNAKRVLRFTTLADLQLADDESPTRLGRYDSSDITSSALRPEDQYLCRMANAAVRTINALHKKDPIAFTILGGDNADSAQTNELDWALGILSGAKSVECDSGDEDDPIPGPDNDGKDPFVAEGLAMPWKWVTGNHDVLVQGNLRVDEDNKKAVLGVDANGGTRDYRKGGNITEPDEPIIADPRRALLTRPAMIAKVASDKDGHGLGDDQKKSGRATYTFDADGNFRFVVIDTAHEDGGAEGVITQREVDRAIKPLLDKAKADGKWVILASHHSQTSLSIDGGTFGKVEPDALSPDAWAAFVGQYPNVLFSMVGHSHKNRVKSVVPATGHAWWEVMTAAIADYPHQFRVIEIFDQDNGWIMMRAVAVDFSVEGDPVAEMGRKGGNIDFTSGWLPSTGVGEPSDRNVELWIKKPTQ